ncbi:class A beta-lactamase-related serine hydrolase [Lentilactobacillus sp. IMAU92037]|uniref:serine hydrolase n=1 Tax=Lentilactobacillus TaxID=2767893 RepID=UPI001C25E3D2|nr:MULTISPECIES: serine hydrolase [Lentilactobacillus]MBU9788717.1 class A beta-lactamase-related serine hydrolase [Lentilactobacillus dabitei]MBV0931530.1 class A beta-lactamase-related serine hydrolase [Lentilactobacillus dabitei]MDM7515716.1 serine hydrolase [Lentilactobacillus sp. TOM.63]
MKFGLSTSILAVAGIVMLAGCSAHQPNDHHSDSKVGRVASSSTKVPPKKATGSSASTVKSAKVTKAVRATVQQASGTTAVYVASANHPLATGIAVNRRQRSASVIKVFIMIEAMRRVKAGALNLKQAVAIPAHDQVGGTGVLAQRGTNQQTIGQLLELMIKVSDNTATNVLIDQLGGLSKINRTIENLGCHHTKLQRKMLDYRALNAGHDNYTSAADLGRTLLKIDRHQLLGGRYDTEMLRLLANNANQTKLPALISSRATIYNKTGEFPDYGVQNDAAIVKKGQQSFVVVVLSESGRQNQQIDAMNLLGKHLYQIFFQ